jgi:hypothetical protein
MRNPSCTEHDLQADEGIMPTRGLQPLDPPAEDAKEAGGVCPTTVSIPEPPGDAEEAGGVPAVVIETLKPPEDVQEAGGARAAIVSTPEQPEDPEGPENTLLVEEVDVEALEARTPAEDKHTACPVAKVPSQPRSLDLDDPAVPVAYLASSCTAIPMEISPRLDSQQTGIGDIYLDDVLSKSEATLSTQHKFSHKSHDPETRVHHPVKVSALHGLQPHGCHLQQQIKSPFLPSIRVQQVSAGPGPYPQVVLLQTEPFTHQSTSHLDSSPATLSRPHILTHKDDPVVLSPSTGDGTMPTLSGNDPHHRHEHTARLAPHPFACPDLPSYHAHINTLADTTTEALTLRKSSILLPAQDHARNEGECGTQHGERPWATYNFP